MDRGFPERISAFLSSKMDAIKQTHGEHSREYLGIARQYVRTDAESRESLEDNLQHYKAALGKDAGLKRSERLYRRTAVINISQACISNCRFCLRSNYENESLSQDDLLNFARYCGNQENRNDLTEILVTGGDPLLALGRLKYLIAAIRECAPNVRRIRIGSRLPLQDPARIDTELLSLFQTSVGGTQFELAIQINHPTELFAESQAALTRISEAGDRIYAQNVLLKGVNDDIDVLAELYDCLRQLGVETHYLFHCCPIVGTRHFRTSLRSGLDLARELTSSGRISGRSKPLFAAMTDIGKIVLYDGAILEQKGPRLLIQSCYSYEERIRWNPTWELPKSAEIAPDGTLRVWYLDGEDTTCSATNEALAFNLRDGAPPVVLPL